MKKTLAILSIIAVMLDLCHAQTNSAPPASGIAGLFGNLPPLDANSTLFANGSVELRVGAIINPAEEQLGVSYFFTKDIAVWGEALNGIGNTVDASHLGLEFAHPVGPVRLGGFLGGGRSFTGKTWEGIAGIRASYVPVSSMPNTFLFVENALIVDKTFNQGTQHYQVRAGLGYRF